MKKSTLILAGAAVVLAAVVLLTTGRDAAPIAASLDIPGYATPAQLEQDKTRKLLEGPLQIDHPIDEIELVRGDETVHLVKVGAGKQTRWTITAPVDGIAVKYLVDKIAAVFKTDTASAFSTAAKEAELGYYDLEPERRIGLTLKSKGAVYRGVDLWVGAAVTPEDAEPNAEPEADTWVMRKGDPSTVFRIVGKDLRTPIEADLEALRDKRVFANRLEDVVEVRITPPSGEAIVLTGTRKETAPASGEEPAKVEVDWALTTPAGVEGDSSISSVARGLTTLRAQSFVPAADAPKDALGAAPWTIEAKLHEAEPLVLKVAAEGDPEVWAQVAGRDELLKLSQYSANSLRKTVADLRDKIVVDIDKGTIDALTLQHEETGAPLSLIKSQGGLWRFGDSHLSFAADPTSLLSAMSRVPAARWAEPDEVQAAREALADPAIRGVIQAGADRYELRFSKVMAGGELEGKRWGVVGKATTAEPFLINDYAAKRFVTVPDALRLKKLFMGRSAADVVRLEIRRPGASDSLVLTRPEGGGELTLAVVPEGKAVDAATVRTMASTFAALMVKGFADDKAPADVGLGGADAGTRVVGRFADGQEVTLRVSEQADEGARYATVDVGPQAGRVVTLNQYQVRNLLKTANELVK
ncbi:MAG: hypothetical protein CSA66_03760 [Proteobacteria bacterium]|nr:MAG: hypothetical protein CSA66_03760 [Pseudomonadota bacterium]